MSKKAITMAKNWVLNSGIQNMTGNNCGGFNSWFDTKTGKYPYVYSEITGYGITTLLFLKRVFNEDYDDRARLAADWLINNAASDRWGVKTRHYQQDMAEFESYSFERGKIYAFDNGMVLYGLINLYKDCKDEKYLEFSKKIADFLINTMRKDDGTFFASYDPKTRDREDLPAKWSSQSGSYHAKIALGLTDLYDVTKDDSYKDVVLDLCRASMTFQDPTGRFITSREDKSTHLHPHAYSAEGLLYAGMYFNKDEFISSAEKAVMWALDNQYEDGGIPKKFVNSGFIELYRSDVLAQILRLAVILKGLGRLDQKHAAMMEKLKNKLLNFQHDSDDLQAGGFYYGFTLDGVKKKHINSWCSMFALQALIMYDEGKGQGARVKGHDAAMNRMECFV